MSILTQNGFTPPQLPKEVRVAQTANRIKGMSAEAYRHICEVQKRGITMVFENQGLTAQEIADGLGTDAGKVFQYHGLLTDFVVALATAEGITPDIKLPKNKFTVNADGTVTVLDEPYSA